MEKLTNGALVTPTPALGFWKRTLKKYPVVLKELVCIVYVRSIMDYASPIWDLHIK